MARNGPPPQNGAGAGGQIPAPGQEPHGPVVDLLVAGHGALHGLRDLVKAGGSRMMKSYRVGSFSSRGSDRTRRRQESIRSSRPLRAALARAISTASSETSTAVTCFAPPRARSGRRSRYGLKQSQHGFPGRQPSHAPAVVLLVQKEAGRLPVLHVHQISGCRFPYLCQGGDGRVSPGRGNQPLCWGRPSLSRRAASFPLVDAPDRLSVCPQDPASMGSSVPFIRSIPTTAPARRADRELVHRQSGKAVRLA